MGKLRPSPWRFITSEGADLSASIFIGAKGSFYVQDDSDPDKIIHELMYAGMGFQVGKGLPVGFSFSTADFENLYLGRIYYGPRNYFGISTDDFGGAGIIISGALANVVGTKILGNANSGNLSLVIWSLPFGFFRNPMKVVAAECYALGVISGTSVATPGVSVSACPVVFSVDP